MKKATVKPAKTSEASPKTSKKTVKKVAVAPAAAVAPRAKKPAAPKAPAVKAAASKSATLIRAAIDVGFGNALFVRGEGPGLSWDVGLPMVCVADDQWSFEIAGASKPVVFKFLINDALWCVGADYVVGAGEQITLTPTF